MALQVYQVEPAGKLGYEIHAQLPGINKEGAKWVLPSGASPYLHRDV